MVVDPLVLLATILMVGSFVAILLNRTTDPSLRAVWYVIIYISGVAGFILLLMALFRF